MPRQCASRWVSLTFHELSKMFSRNFVWQKPYYLWEFQAETLYVCPHTKFQLEIRTIYVISGIVYFRAMFWRARAMLVKASHGTPEKLTHSTCRVQSGPQFKINPITCGCTRTETAWTWKVRYLLLYWFAINAIIYIKWRKTYMKDGGHIGRGINQTRIGWRIYFVNNLYGGTMEISTSARIQPASMQKPW